jgi:hypothetical protein
VTDSKPTCGANRRQGNGPCRRPAGWGTDHPGYGPCKLHFGATRNMRAHAQKAQAAELLESMRTYGELRRIDPRDGVMEEYWRTAGIVLYLEQIVQSLQRGELVWGVVERTEAATADDGEQDGEQDGDASASRDRAAAVVWKAAPNVWQRMYGEERDRFAKLGLEIIKLGLEARRDEWIREQGTRLAGMVQAVTSGLIAALPDLLGLDDGQRRQLEAVSSTLPASLWQAEVARMSAQPRAVEGRA